MGPSDAAIMLPGIYPKGPDEDLGPQKIHAGMSTHFITTSKMTPSR